MKPFLHGKSSAKRWGGLPQDYQAIHDFLDSPKSAHPDMRHRAILHNSLGPFIAERVFGTNITNSDGKLVSVRDIAERHILEDVGFIPTVSDYLNLMPMPDWIGGPARKIESRRPQELPAPAPVSNPSPDLAKLEEEMTVEAIAQRRKRFYPKNLGPDYID